jgi:hypothetical protein
VRHRETASQGEEAAARPAVKGRAWWSSDLGDRLASTPAAGTNGTESLSSGGGFGRRRLAAPDEVAVTRCFGGAPALLDPVDEFPWMALCHRGARAPESAAAAFSDSGGVRQGGAGLVVGARRSGKICAARSGVSRDGNGLTAPGSAPREGVARRAPALDDGVGADSGYRRGRGAELAVAVPTAPGGS